MTTYNMRIIQQILDVVTEAITHDSRNTHNEQTWVVFGASGFVGRWLTLLGQSIKDRGIAPVHVAAISRNPIGARRKILELFPPDIPLPVIQTYKDFFDFNPKFPLFSNNTTVFHAATSSDPSAADTRTSFDLTEGLLKWVQKHPHTNIIHLSSGAVYDVDPGRNLPIQESDRIRDINSNLNDYQWTKISIEESLKRAISEGHTKGVNARLFAFLGPGFPLSGHFAASRFMTAAMNGSDIEIAGNPATTRSYMSPQDLLIWLAKIWLNIDSLNGEALNIGSEVPVTMLELAETFQCTFGNGRVFLSEDSPKTSATHYFPSTSKIKSLISLPRLLEFNQSIIQWKSVLEVGRN